jgi:mRNA interferase MazF
MLPDFCSIVLVPFPCTDLSASKVRPALVVSRRRRGGDVIVCFMSSRLDRSSRALPRLHPTPGNGLRAPSVMRFDKIAMLEPKVIHGILGRANRQWLRRRRTAFFRVF